MKVALSEAISGLDGYVLSAPTPEHCTCFCFETAFLQLVEISAHYPFPRTWPLFKLATQIWLRAKSILPKDGSSSTFWWVVAFSSWVLRCRKQSSCRQKGFQFQIVKLKTRLTLTLHIYMLRGAFKSNFWKNLGIWPNQVDPPPSPKVGTPKTKKKKIDVYFAF